MGCVVVPRVDDGLLHSMARLCALGGVEVVLAQADADGAAEGAERGLGPPRNAHGVGALGPRGGELKEGTEGVRSKGVGRSQGNNH